VTPAVLGGEAPAIAAQLVRTPDLVLMDEPTTT
jgi:energy-coupling factor transporter ATP-binding protein EcfA2